VLWRERRRLVQTSRDPLSWPGVWLGERRGHAIDWVTQRWVQLTGRRLGLTQAPWLSGPCGSVRGIGPDFFERRGETHGLTVLPSRPDDGLIDDGMGVLKAAAFDLATLHPRINDFYAHFHVTRRRARAWTTMVEPSRNSRTATIASSQRSRARRDYKASAGRAATRPVAATAALDEVARELDCTSLASSTSIAFAASCATAFTSRCSTPSGNRSA
jgi:hypothetical protein